MNKFTIEDLRDIAYRGSYDDLERELALQLLVSMEQAPVYLRHFGDDGETFVACDGNDERAITLYAAPQLPQPEVPLPVSVVKGELGFINHLERIIGERDEDIDIGQLGCGNYDALMLAALDAFRAAMLQDGNSPVIPDGWQLVPKEPTEAMNKAGWAAINEHDAINPTYRAMLAAAPQQEVKSAFEHGMHRYAGAMQKLSEGDK